MVQKYPATEITLGDTIISYPFYYIDSGKLVEVYLPNSKEELSTVSSEPYSYPISTADNKELRQRSIIDYQFPDANPLSSTEERVIVTGEIEGNYNNHKTLTVLSFYLNNFIGILRGNYLLHHSFNTSHGFTIVALPMCGSVQVYTTDGLFHISYHRNDDGVLVGEMARARFTPFMRNKAREEIEDHLEDGTPVYLSYYDPMGSGERISREEYQHYMTQRAGIIQEKTGFPKELSNLLGF